MPSYIKLNIVHCRTKVKDKSHQKELKNKVFRATNKNKEHS